MLCPSLAKSEIATTSGCMQKQTKRQHHTPRYYLSQFSGGDGAVWTYLRDQQLCRPFDPGAIGFENYFYSFIDDDGWNYSWDDWLTNTVEKPAQTSDTYGKLLRGERLNELEKQDLALYFGAMWARAPMRREEAKERLALVRRCKVERIWRTKEEFARYVIVRLCPIFDDYSAEFVEAQWNLYEKGTIPGPEGEKEFLLQMLRLSGPVAASMMDKEWVTIRAAQTPFFSCDSPVYRLLDKITGPDAAYAIPISKSTLLLIGAPEIVKPFIEVLGPDPASGMNRVVARSAQRHLYAPACYLELRELAALDLFPSPFAHLTPELLAARAYS
jgi:hypothetical protein